MRLWRKSCADERGNEEVDNIVIPKYCLLVVVTVVVVVVADAKITGIVAKVVAVVVFVFEVALIGVLLMSCYSHFYR